MPDTVPEAMPIVATADPLLDHTPEGVAVANVAVEPLQSLPVPVIGAGEG